MANKETILIALVVVLLVVTAIQAYQITALNTKATALATGNFKIVGSSGAGFASEEEMMAAHHGGEAPAAAQGIGGCS